MIAAAKNPRRARLERNRASILNQPHLLYIHIDPITRELLYVGMSSSRERPFVFYGRNASHGHHLRRLESANIPKPRIAHIVARGLSFSRAQQLEAELIARLQPVYNGGANA